MSSPGERGRERGTFNGGKEKKTKKSGPNREKGIPCANRKGGDHFEEKRRRGQRPEEKWIHRKTIQAYSSQHFQKESNLKERKGATANAGKGKKQISNHCGGEKRKDVPARPYSRGGEKLCLSKPGKERPAHGGKERKLPLPLDQREQAL